MRPARLLILALVLGLLSTVITAVALTPIGRDIDMRDDPDNWKTHGWHDGTHVCMTAMRARSWSVEVSHGQFAMTEEQAQGIIDSGKLDESEFGNAPWSVGAQVFESKTADTQKWGLGVFQRSIWDVARGWPMPALRHRYYYDRQSGNVPPTINTLNGIQIEAPTLDHPIPRIIPMTPVFPGFIVDVGVHGSIWFALLFGLRLARRGILRARGRCMQCGYQLQGVEGACPECGAPAAIATTPQGS